MNLDLIIEEFFFYLDYFNMTDLRSLVSPPPFAEWGIDEWDKIKLRTIGN